MAGCAWVVVGALARIDPRDRRGVVTRLNELPGVRTFSLDEPGRIGLLIEGPGLSEVHATVVGRLRGVPGVQGVWPVSVEWDPLEASATGPEPVTTFSNDED